MPSVNGVGSGLDIEALIEASLITRRRSIEVLEAKKSLLSVQQGAVLGLRTRVASFKSAAESVKGLASSMMGAGSSDPLALGATATASATEGSHDVKITSLAQSHRIAAAGFVDANSTAVAGGVGKFEVRVADGATLSVDVDATTTLQELVDAINGEGGSVTASIVNDGSALNPHRMVLTAKNPGSTNVINIVTNDTTLNLSTNAFEQPSIHDANSGDYTGAVTISGAFTGTASRAYTIEILTEGAADTATYRVSLDGGTTWDDNSGAGYSASTVAADVGGGTTPAGLQVDFTNSGTLRVGDKFTFDAFHPSLRDAKDAFIEIDGITVQSDSNTITGALEGVTLNLKSADPTETLTLSVVKSTQDIEAAVASFVSAYNDLVGGIRDEQSYDAESNRAGALLGDQVANRIVYDVSSALTLDVAGATGTFKTLSEIGLTVDKDGVLSLNKTMLSSAIGEDTDSVLEILEGATSPSDSALSAVSTPTTVPAGSYSVNITQAAAKATIDAGAAMSGALTANETLDFSYTSDATGTSPLTTAFQVVLSSGRTLTQVVADLNDEFKSRGVAMVASDSSGVLRLESTEFGADYEITAFSDRSGAGSTQIGLTTQTGTGIDIQGTIGGAIGDGLGATLTAAGGSVDGLAVSYEGTDLGVIGSLAVVQGASARFASIAERLLDKDAGPITARDESLKSQIESLDDRIAERRRLLRLTEQRVRSQYVALDAALGRMRAQGDALLQSVLAIGSGG